MRLDYERHELSSLCGDLPEDEFNDFKFDIIEHGVIEKKIILLDGKILDGWHRYRAVSEIIQSGTTLDSELVFAEYQGTSPNTYVLSKNEIRRHLNSSQRAMVTVKLNDWKPHGSNQYDKVDDPNGSSTLSTREMADKSNTNKTAIIRGKKVERADPELGDEVVKGNITLFHAEKIVDSRNAPSPAPVEDVPELFEEPAPAELELQKVRKQLEDANKKLAEVPVVSPPKIEELDNVVVIESPEEAAAFANFKKTEERKARKAARRIERDQELSKSATVLPSGEQRYSVILADPPWRYDFSQTVDREIENHYPTMTIEEIKDMDVASICHDDAVLYLWTTTAKLPLGLEVMESWGFTYKSSAVWVKDKIGMGYWFRGRHEFLLVGTRGKFPPPKAELRRDSIFEDMRTEHSKKPDIVIEYLDEIFPDYAKIELFCRNPREGWDVWGNEV